MKNLVEMDKHYKQWIKELGERYRSSQIKAASLVNRTMLAFYWSLGRDITIHEDENVRGSSFFESLSNDLKRIIPDAKGFSATNLKYMRRFYELFPLNNRPQLVDGNSDSSKSGNRPQLADDSDVIFSIPWGHIRTLLDKCKGDLAQEITKDPYNFDFLTIRPKYDESQLKDALMDNIQRFLLELGTGFSFIGREYRLLAGKAEQFIDLLFYNFQIHCFVVVEVKVTDFNPRDMGQLITYVSAVDGIMKKEGDQPTVGLLICKTKDNVLAKYATNAVKVPVGISEYQLTHFLADEFKGTLPTIEELEQELGQN